MIFYPKLPEAIMKLSKSLLTLSCASALTLSSNITLASDSVPLKVMADALHIVLDSDRAIYTKKVVGRLVKKDKVIKASEHFIDDKSLPLPAQMFRMGSENVADRISSNPDINFSYSLQSLWPINSQNAPKTKAEKEGLKYIADNPGKNFYQKEKLGGTTYYTAIYPDIGVAPVCVSCHNKHKDSPKTDFKIGEVMGGVVIRIPVDG